MISVARRAAIPKLSILFSSARLADIPGTRATQQRYPRNVTYCTNVNYRNCSRAEITVRGVASGKSGGEKGLRRVTGPRKQITRLRYFPRCL